MKLIEYILSLFRWPDIEPVELVEPATPKRTLAWGRKVSPAFRARLFEIAAIIGIDPDYIMACIAFETTETFSPSIKNGAGSGATGLIQFMPPTAIGLGTTVEALAAMTAVQQLDYVLAYFKPYRSRLITLSDVYMAILYPRAIGKPDDYVLFSGGIAYRQNAGLDANKDGGVTKFEASAKVYAMLEKGRSAKYLWMEA